MAGKEVKQYGKFKVLNLDPIYKYVHIRMSKDARILKFSNLEVLYLDDESSEYIKEVTFVFVEHYEIVDMGWIYLDTWKDNREYSNFDRKFYHIFMFETEVEKRPQPRAYMGDPENES